MAHPGADLSLVPCARGQSGRHGLGATLLLGWLAACSATPARLDVPAQPGVRTTFERGAPLLHSEKTNRVILKLIDRDEDELLLGVAVENGEGVAFEISTDDVRLATGDAAAPRVDAKVYSFDELPGEVDTSLAWDSAQAAAGVAAMPIGGIWGSLARTVMQLGVRAGRGSPETESGGPARSASIEDLYLRRHTLEADAEYRGLVVARLARAPEPGDSLWVTVTTGAEEHIFRVAFVAP